MQDKVTTSATSDSANPDHAPKSANDFWIAVLCGAAILTIGIGARSSFGIFQKPIAADLHVGREVWSFANALAGLVVGLLSPFVGTLADRFGAARTVAVGGVVYVAGLVMTGLAQESTLLTFGNVVSGVGMGTAGFGPIFGAIARRTPPDKRSIALGVTSAGGSFGQFALVPFASLLLTRLQDWHATIFCLAAVSVVMIPLALGLREQGTSSAQASAAAPQGAKGALGEALTTRGYWLLLVGFFVCGFHVTFIGLHMPAYISDKAVGLTLFGFSLSPLELGGWSIGLVGLFNIAGTLLWGWLGGKYRKKDMLALLYALRGLAFLMFLILPLSGGSVLLFSASLGFLWLGTIPLTSGLVGYIFGPTHMSMLWGLVFLSHQLGSFLGGWAPGRLYDIQGSYEAMWWISILLALFAAAIHWFISEQPVARLRSQPAAA